jgi:hypothetical protein
MTFRPLWILYLFVSLYFIFLFVYIIFILKCDLNSTIKFVSNWQTLTAAMIALCASTIALHISGYREEKQRERNFVAARAFLPNALAEITTYCDYSIEFYFDNLSSSSAKTDSEPLTKSSLQAIKECISYANPDAARNLSQIISLLQVHYSRMLGACSKENTSNVSANSKERKNLHELLHTCFIKHIVSCNFDFARGEATSFHEIDVNVQDLLRQLPTHVVGSPKYGDKIKKYFKENYNAISNLIK